MLFCYTKNFNLLKWRHYEKQFQLQRPFFLISFLIWRVVSLIKTLCIEKLEPYLSDLQWMIKNCFFADSYVCQDKEVMMFSHSAHQISLYFTGQFATMLTYPTSSFSFSRLIILLCFFFLSLHLLTVSYWRQNCEFWVKWAGMTILKMFRMLLAKFGSVIWSNEYEALYSKEFQNWHQIYSFATLCFRDHLYYFPLPFYYLIFPLYSPVRENLWILGYWTCFGYWFWFVRIAAQLCINTRVLTFRDYRWIILKITPRKKGRV